MARVFDETVPQYIHVTSAPATAVPITMGCWFNSDDITIEQSMMSLGSPTGNGFVLMLRGNIGGDYVSALSSENWTWAFANSISGYSADTWHHGCAVFTSPTSRASFIDGGSKGTNASSNTPTNITTTTIGAKYMGGYTLSMSGSIAEPAMWNVALTDEEIAAWATGISPLMIRPGNLIFYVPCVRDNDEDLIGGLSLTASGSPTITAHPPVLYPAPPMFHMEKSVSGIVIVLDTA